MPFEFDLIRRLPAVVYHSTKFINCLFCFSASNRIR
uniref:Uncharacterized protein n=1 Tax=Arundo donax TaxID=35708 RepID=A0A0A9A908_ARUDO